MDLTDFLYSRNMGYKKIEYLPIITLSKISSPKTNYMFIYLKILPRKYKTTTSQCHHIYIKRQFGIVPTTFH